MQVQMHPAEHFLNWYPHNTKLYIRGERGKDWNKQMALHKELFDQLVPWLDALISAERDRVVDLHSHKHDERSPVPCQKCIEWESLTGPSKA